MTKYRICVIAEQGGCKHADIDECQAKHNMPHAEREWCTRQGCNDLHRSHADGVCRELTVEEVAAARLRGEL